jgi:hypothetical protein
MMIGSICAQGLSGDVVPQSGLILDLDAAKGVECDTSNKVLSWNNQVIGARAQAFKPNPIGRTDPAAGVPTRLDSAISSGEHSTIQFNRQELINGDEDAFDHLIQGNGYTWLAVIAVYEQTSPVKNTHAFFGNLRNTTAFEGQGTGGHYEGFWGVVHDDRHVYAGTRNGIEGELARLLIYERPSSDQELSKAMLQLCESYHVQR